MLQKWRYLRSEAEAPDMNMAIDEALMMSVGAGEVGPTLRFYGWNPATLSIGYFQKAAEEVDLAEVKARGLGFVRRPTGGRAVLHDRELTYSIIIPESYPGLPESVVDSYRLLSEGMLRGLQALGLAASMVSLSSDQEKAKYAGAASGASSGSTASAEPASSAASAACFDSPSWYELVIDGRKVAGSAQLRQHRALLQHGSILLDLDAAQLFDVLQFRTERQRERMQWAFAERAAAINPLRASRGLPPISIGEAEEAFARGWATSLGVELSCGELTAAERVTAEELARDKYRSDSWNFRR